MKLANLTKMIMTDSFAQVRIENILNKSFLLIQGLNQGDRLTSPLFLGQEYEIRENDIDWLSVQVGFVYNKIVAYANDIPVIT